MVIKRNARERGPQRRHQASDDGHDPGIKGMFLQNRRERGKEKGDQRKMLHELMGWAGLMGQEGLIGRAGHGVQTRGGGRGLSPLLLSLVGCWAGS